MDKLFTQDILDAMKNMQQSEMFSLLKDLQSTNHWIAILKYNYDRRANAHAMLATIDPIKEPTSMARTQGILSGLSDLEEIVRRLNTPPEKEDDEESDISSSTNA
jgi:hypothetical protein